MYLIDGKLEGFIPRMCSVDGFSEEFKIHKRRNVVISSLVIQWLFRSSKGFFRKFEALFNAYRKAARI